MKKAFLLLSAVFVFSGCLKEEQLFLPLVTIEPAPIDDGWEVADPEAEGVNAQELRAVYDHIHSSEEPWQLRSLLVIRNGKLIGEHYFKDPGDLYQPRPIWSCTKQVVGMLAGIAVSEGVLGSIEDPISMYLPDALNGHDDKADITIGNLLSMKSGIDFDERSDVSKILQRKPDNVLDFILGLPMLYEPGSTFNYNSGDPHLITASIQNAAGEGLAQWADRVLFQPIGFRRYSWLSYDGYEFGGFGISTTPRELAKLAQLVLNGGSWQGEPIIDSMWVDEMTTTQTATSDDSDYTFGRLWWVNEPESIYFMSGSGGQYACIVPGQKLIVVGMSEHDTDGDLEIDFDTFLAIVNEIRAAAD